MARKPSPPSNRSKKTTSVAATAAAAGESSSKYQRVFFTKEDTITILKAMLQYRSDTGNDPTTHYASFHNSLNDCLSVKPTIRQLVEKIRTLKLKYDKDCRNNEKPVTFTSDFKKEQFELADKFWGNENEVVVREIQSKNEDVAEKPKPAVILPPKHEPVVSDMELSEEEEFEDGESSDDDMSYFNTPMWEKFDFYDVNFLKRGWELVEESKKRELEKRWKKLRIAELELFAKRAQLVGEQTESILEAYRKAF